MSHAGFDGLHNPMGLLVITVSFFLLTAVIIGGSFLVKAAQIREKEVRAKLRQEHLDKQKP